MKDRVGLQLILLGQPEVWVDGQQVVKGLPVKGMALLAYLAITGRPHTREGLAGLLWGGMADEAARVNLRVTLNRLAPRLRPFLTLTHHTISLNPELVMVDVSVLESAVTRRDDPTAWENAVGLYHGDFLDGLTVPDAPAFEEWALLERERLRLLLIDMLHRLAAAAIDRQAATTGIAFARRILALDSWREEAHCLLMRLLALNGRRSEALAQFESCRRLLVENLGVEPAPETIALYEAIKGNRLPPVPPLIPSSTSLPPHPPVPPHNLPAVAASFVGREPELAQLAALLAQPDGRLLTILGPGGVGKTRLALETAGRHVEDSRFADGVFFVPLADLRPGSDIAPLLAEMIGLNLTAAQTVEVQLLHALQERRLLLVLDNFEHLLPQADLVARLLATARGVRFIITSRERLNLYEEWLIEIAGLALPPGAVTDWADYSAPQLFIQRARRVYLGFDSAAEMEAILHICHLVWGLPLALELAAAWVRTISCREIAHIIEDNLADLTSSLRNVPERHRSLQAAFDTSWRLLTEEEQGILERLAVFRGGFEEAAAGRVVEASLRRLSALVDKSLVQRRPDGRYYLHEVIRSLTQAKLAAPEWQEIRAAHTRYYAQFLAEQGAKSTGPEGEASFRATAMELENGRFAWMWALEQLPDDTATAFLGQLLPQLSLFYLRRGRSLEAADWLAEAVRHVEAVNTAVGDSPTRRRLLAQLHHQLAKQEEALGHFRQAQERLLACLPELEGAGITDFADYMTAVTADAWEILGRTQRLLGDVPGAEASYRRSLELHRIKGDYSNVAGILNSLGVLTKNAGRYAEAIAYYTESLNIFRQQGDSSGVAVCLINLGNIANVQGEYGRARACYQESYELAVTTEDRPQVAINLLNLGSVARATGELETAERNYRDSLALGREMERGPIVAAALDGLGQTLLRAGNLAAARAILREGLETAVSLQAQTMILTVLASIGQALRLTGLVEGTWLLELVLNHDSTAHYVRQEVAAVTATHEITLSQTSKAALTLEEGINLAMALLVPAT